MLLSRAHSLAPLWQVMLLIKLVRHGASWHQKNQWKGANRDEEYTPLQEAAKDYTALYNDLHLKELAAQKT